MLTDESNARTAFLRRKGGGTYVTLYYESEFCWQDFACKPQKCTEELAKKEMCKQHHFVFIFLCEFSFDWF